MTERPHDAAEGIRIDVDINRRPAVAEVVELGESVIVGRGQVLRVRWGSDLGHPWIWRIAYGVAFTWLSHARVESVSGVGISTR